MFQYHCLNPIAGVGLANFNENYQQTESLEGADAVLVRSAAMHGMELPKSLLAVARAGAGVNNIPLTDCAEQGKTATSQRQQKNRKRNLPAARSAERNSVSSALVPSASLWQMQPPILVWKYTDTIHTFLSMQHGTCPAIFITSRTWKISTAPAITSPFMCR